MRKLSLRRRRREYIIKGFERSLIMSSLAQEESRSISENVKWGQRKRFADGKVSLPYKQFLGYEKGEDGFPKLIEEEAKIVKLIYILDFFRN